MKNKRGFSAIALIIILAVLAGGYAIWKEQTANFVLPTPDLSTADWKIYTDKDNEFEIKYPPSWHTQFIQSDVFFLPSGIDIKPGVDVNTFITEKIRIQVSFGGAKTGSMIPSSAQKIVHGDDIYYISGAPSDILRKAISTLRFVSATPQTDVSNWKTYTNLSTGVSIKYPPTVKLDGPNPYIIVGFANIPTLISNRLQTDGYQARANYNSFDDLINDIKLKKDNNIIRILGDVTVGGVKGYEINWNGKTGVWVVSDTNLYAFYFNKTEKLSELDKQILLLIHLPDNTKLAPNISAWKTYRNDKYGFEFKYPASLVGHVSDNNGMTLVGPCLVGGVYDTQQTFDTNRGTDNDASGIFEFCVVDTRSNGMTPKSNSSYGRVLPLSQKGQFFIFDSTVSQAYSDQILSTFRFVK